MLTASLVSLLNPLASAVTVYVPGCTKGMAKLPLPLVLVVYTCCGPLAVMNALGINAPVGSETLPMMMPRNSCPESVTAIIACNSRNAKSSAPRDVSLAAARGRQEIVVVDRAFLDKVCGKASAAGARSSLVFDVFMLQPPGEYASHHAWQIARNFRG